VFGVGIAACAYATGHERIGDDFEEQRVLAHRVANRHHRIGRCRHGRCDRTLQTRASAGVRACPAGSTRNVQHVQCAARAVPSLSAQHDARSTARPLASLSAAVGFELVEHREVAHPSPQIETANGARARVPRSGHTARHRHRALHLSMRSHSLATHWRFSASTARSFLMPSASRATVAASGCAP
jgi:hypothetical protein